MSAYREGGPLPQPEAELARALQEQLAEALLNLRQLARAAVGRTPEEMRFRTVRSAALELAARTAEEELNQLSGDARGSSTTNVAPAPGSERTSSRPPMR